MMPQLLDLILVTEETGKRLLRQVPMRLKVHERGSYSAVKQRTHEVIGSTEAGIVHLSNLLTRLVCFFELLSQRPGRQRHLPDRTVAPNQSYLHRTQVIRPIRHVAQEECLLPE